MTLRESLASAQEGGYAIPHFNVSDSTQLNTIAKLAVEREQTVVIGASKGAEAFFGREVLAGMVGVLRKLGAPLFLNADHCHDVERAKKAIDAGFDAVIIDGSTLSMEENIAQTREVVAYARGCGRDVLVEGELGYIGSSSALLDDIPEGAGLTLTSVEDAEMFVRDTGVDLFSPSVGNIHGMLKHSANPKLDIERISMIADSMDASLVLHGGSGISDEDFTAAIKAGIRIVHINTELRRAYRTGIEGALTANPDEVAPYKYLTKGAEMMEEVVENRMNLFANK